MSSEIFNGSDKEDLRCPESEAGIIATLIHHPEFIFFSEKLQPAHFADKQNRCIYQAIRQLAEKEITVIDPYNILEVLNSTEATRKYAGEITVDNLMELMDMSDVLARQSVEEYKMLVSNVLDVALRREAVQQLKECYRICLDRSNGDVGQKIYNIIDDVMMDYASVDEVPPYKEVVDQYWTDIKLRQQNGFAGIPFKLKTLNEYATIERGELFIFAGGPKQGKSMMLLNCAMDLLRQDVAVLYLDSELNTRLFTARVLAHLSGIEYKRLTAGAYTQEEAKKIDEARAWLKTKKFTHVYVPMFDQQSIYTTVKKVKHTQGIDVLIVDYFKGSGEGDAFDSYQELGRFVDRTLSLCL